MEKHVLTETAAGPVGNNGKAGDDRLSRHLNIYRNILEQCVTGTTLTLLPQTPVQLMNRSRQGSAEGSPRDTLQPWAVSSHLIGLAVSWGWRYMPI